MTTPLEDLPLRDDMEAVRLHDERKADLEQALELLTKAEWPSGWCQGCGYYYKDGHATDCLWANLLSKYNREVRFHD